MPQAFQYDGKSPYLFITAAEKDNAKVMPILARMGENGYHVWYDGGVEGDSLCDDETASRIMNCESVVAMLSNQFLESNQRVAELRYAINNKKKVLLIYLEEVSLKKFPGIDMYAASTESFVRQKDVGSESFYRILFSTMKFQSDEKKKPFFSDFQVKDGILEKYNGSAASVLLPSSVKRIGDFAFRNCTNLERIMIPNSVESIGREAFLGCTSLQSLELPDSVTQVEREAFLGCKRLASVDLSDSLEALDDGVFAGCFELTSLKIPYSVKKIGVGAFFGCAALTQLKIPDSVEKIGEAAFGKCKALKSISMSQNTDISKKTFDNCAAKITFYDEKKVDPTLMSEDEVDAQQAAAESESSTLTAILHKLRRLFVKDYAVKGDYLRKYRGLDNTAVIPDTVVHIGTGAFYNKKNLTTVIIPNSVTSIGMRAFDGCSELESIKIPSSVSNIELWAFANCPKLKQVHISRQTVIRENVFFGSDVHFQYYEPKGEDTKKFHMIGSTLKKYNGSDATVTIPSAVTEIAEKAFAYCTNLKSVSVPNSVTKIETNAFFACQNLIVISIPDSVTYIGERAFQSCTNLLSFVIPNSVSFIEAGLFEMCLSLAAVEIPDSVTYIGTGAFYRCSSLRDISIPNSVTSIGEWAFCGCKSLEEITIPSTVKNVESYAFSDCPMLKTVHLSHKTRVEKFAFKNSPAHLVYTD